MVLKDARHQFGGRTARLTIYLGGLALIALAIVDRRRKNVDPAVRRRQSTLDQQLNSIRKAANMPGRESAEQIASALRKIIAEVPDADRSDVQTVLTECENLVYSPDDLTRRADASLADRATKAARSMIEK